MEIVEEDTNVLIVTKNGYGKRTPVEEYRLQSVVVKVLKLVTLQIKTVS